MTMIVAPSSFPNISKRRKDQSPLLTSMILMRMGLSTGLGQMQS